MARTFWIAASLLTATLTAAGGQPVESKTGSSAKPVERLITIQEANRPAQICRMIQSWRMPNGLKAYDMQTVGSGARLTVVETGPADTKTSTGQRAVATQIYHWTADGKRPNGCPAPTASTQPAAPAVASTVRPTAKAAPVVTSSHPVSRPMPVAKPNEIQRVAADEKIPAPVEKPKTTGQVHPDAAARESCEEECRPGRRPSLLNSLRRRRVECVECPKPEVAPCPAPVSQPCPAPVTKVCPPAGPHVVKPMAPVSVHAAPLTICDDDCEKAPKHKLLPRLRKNKEQICVSEEPYPHGVPTAVKVVGEDTRVNMPSEPPVKACVTEAKPTVPKPYMPAATEPAPASDLRESWGKPLSEPAKPVETVVKAATPKPSDSDALKKSPDPLMNPDRFQPPTAEEGLAAPATEPSAEVPLCSKECRPGRRPNLISVMTRMKGGNGGFGEKLASGSSGFAPPCFPAVPDTGGVGSMSVPAAAVPYGPPPGPPNPNQKVFRGQPCCTPPRGMANAFTEPGVQQPVPAETFVGNQSVNAFSGPDGPFVPGGALAGPPPCCPSPLPPCPKPGPGLGTLTDNHFVPARGFTMPGQPLPGTPGNQTPTLPNPTPGGTPPTLPNPTPGQPMAQSMAPQSEAAAQLLQMLKASDFPSQREWAADQLASMGQDPAVTAGLLDAAKHDPAPLVRAGSIRALVDLSAKDATVVAALQELHKDAEPMVRDAAAQALTTFGAPVMPDSSIQRVGGQMPEQR